MGAAEVPYDRTSYTPGDPWTHPEFATLAARSPAIEATLNSGENTTPSYFESRSFRGEIQKIEVGTSGGTVVLQRSFDGGDSWHNVETYSSATEKTIDYRNFVMLRLRVTSGSNVTCRLIQGL